MQISNRLKAVASFVTSGNRVADIGCDHGYVPIYLIEEGKIPSAIAMDVNKGPLLRAAEHIESCGLSGYIETRLSDGLAELESGEADTVIIAGMGGPLMQKILEDGREVLETVEELILQPQSDLAGFRRYLTENGYRIADENMIYEDGKYYPILCVLHGESRPLSRTELAFGPILLRKKHPVLLQFIEKEIRLKTEILSRLQSIETPADQTLGRIKEVQEELTLRKEALEKMQTTGEGGRKMLCCDVMEKLNELSPVSYAADWDNVGLLVGRREKEIKTVYIALDATDEVIEKAHEKKADLLLTHHPLIFTGLKRVNSDDVTGRRLLSLIRRDICCYAMHTNFDVMGMADAAADEISLKKREVLEVTYEDEIGKEGFGRIGKLPRIMTLAECADFVKKQFKLAHVRVFGLPDTVLETAAISPGSGKSMISSAVQKGADVLITGDIGHHEGIDANAAGLCIIDAGHFGIEKLFIPYMREYLNRECAELTVYEDDSPEPFSVY